MSWLKKGMPDLRARHVIKPFGCSQVFKAQEIAVAGLSIVLLGLFSFAYLQRRKVFKALERGNYDISALREALDIARTSIGDKEEALAALVKEVEAGRRQIEDGERKLQEALSNNDSLKSQLVDRDLELRRREEDFQRQAHDHALTVQLLELRTSELKGDETFLTKADTISGADVIGLITTLNSEICQTAAMVAETFEFKAKVEGAGRGGEAVNGFAEIHASAVDMVGPRLVEMLSSSEHREDPTLVQIALQAAMVAYSNWIIKSWNLEDPECDMGISKVYKGIRDGEEQAVSGRWRALTRKYLPRTSCHELSLLFVDAFINILLVADVLLPHAQLQKAIETRFTERISIIVDSAQKLRKAIGEEITSFDFEIAFVNHDTVFSPDDMDDAFASEFEKGRQNIEPVLCTTELGLEKFERRTEKGGWESTILVRPKIVLKSQIEAMTISTDNIH
ncbi:hypothetical protein H0H92_011558 [Tricholoma furcatifolium]|nr:hypothetical protein H0H92_011558 [Tricholoma furcatifolium]